MKRRHLSGDRFWNTQSEGSFVLSKEQTHRRQTIPFLEQPQVPTLTWEVRKDSREWEQHLSGGPSLLSHPLSPAALSKGCLPFLGQEYLHKIHRCNAYVPQKKTGLYSKENVYLLWSRVAPWIFNDSCKAAIFGQKSAAEFKHAAHCRLGKSISNTFVSELLPTPRKEKCKFHSVLYLQIILVSLRLSLALSKTEGERNRSICFVIFAPISGNDAKFRYCCPLISYFTGKMSQSFNFPSPTEKLLNQKYKRKHFPTAHHK